MTYNELVSRIRVFEHWQQTKLRCQLGGKMPLPKIPMCNGQIQFASVENAPGVDGDTDLPVVVGVGINYWQEPLLHSAFDPHLGVDPNGRPRVEDTPAPASKPGGLTAPHAAGGSVMRQMVNMTLDSYYSDPEAWTVRQLASSPNISLPSRGNYSYLLLATNFCPFLTFESWQDYWEPYRAAWLSVLGGEFVHLDDLRALLPDGFLWVAHNIGSEVPVLFRLWQTRRCLRNWLLTYNLNRMNPPGSLPKKPLPVAPVNKPDILEVPTDE
jgi:hypothetical protein